MRDKLLRRWCLVLCWLMDHVPERFVPAVERLAILTTPRDY